jgi:hypothetical protein
MEWATSPTGVRWTIHRRWVPRTPVWGALRRATGRAKNIHERSTGVEAAAGDAGWVARDNGWLSAGRVLGTVAVVLGILPFVLLGVAVLWVAGVVVVGVVARVTLRRPWTIHAVAAETKFDREWQVVGWRRSGKAMAYIARTIEESGRPPVALPHERT